MLTKRDLQARSMLFGFRSGSEERFDARDALAVCAAN